LDKLNFVIESVDQKSPDHGTFLFNQLAHLRLQQEEGWWCYSVRKKDICACIYFHVQEGKAVSPLRAPFGSFEMQQLLTDQEFDRWVGFILADLQAKGCKEVQIRNYPLPYAPEATRLIRKGLVIHRFACSEETSSILFITKDSFESKLSISKKQKLKKCIDRFSFATDSLTNLERIYTFIAEARHAKGYELSMNWQQMQRTVQQLPNNFSLFKVEEGEQLAAAAICIRVSDTILYTFYYAHAARYDKLSPVTLLLHGIYQHAANNGIAQIDLGTSLADGKLNPSLLHFKKSVGGKSSPKYSFTKILA